MPHYRELLPSPDTAHLVFLYWEFANHPDGDDFFHEAMPDGTVSIIYNRNNRSGCQRLIVAGIRTEAAKYPILAGDVYLGMRIAPAACSTVLRCDPKAFEMENFLKKGAFEFLKSGMIDAFAKCRNLEDASEVFDGKLKSLGILPSQLDDMVAQSVSMIEESGGAVRISKIADALGVSVRHLQRRFRECSGITPKQYARIRRLYRTATVLTDNDSVNLADLAANMGFADQAHMSRELATLTGRPPHSFAKQVRTIFHGDLAK